MRLSMTPAILACQDHPGARPRRSPHRRAATLILAWLTIGCSPAPSPAPVESLEAGWARLRYWDDQARLVASLGRDSTPTGLSRAVVVESLTAARTQTGRLLAAAGTQERDDQAALAVMRRDWPALSGGSDSAPGPAGPLERLTDSIYQAYTEAASTIVVDGDTLNRLAVLGLLSRTPDAARRQRLFLALAPVWRSINGDNEPVSPYRRLLTLRHNAWQAGSPIDATGPALGLTAAELENWLVEALTRWRASMPLEPLEPWDWYFDTGAAGRRLSPRVPQVTDLLRVTQAAFADWGASPAALNIHFDLAPRVGKDPVSFTDFGTRPVRRNGSWTPGEPWIFTSYLGGGFDNLVELLHETGHGVHLAAIHVRPAFLDWPDNDTYTETLADLPAMEAYEPAWQQRFLGDSVPRAMALRAKYAGIVIDMAWALFEIRIHRDPAQDPNRLWAELTETFLAIRPHPEWSWWAMRGQLVDSPGYLLNYAVGAFLVADLRARIVERRGPNPWHDEDLYAWLSATLYHDGLAVPSPRVLEGFLGHRPRPDPLLTELGRMIP